MSRSIIAVDIDDVLAGENETMRQFINQTYGLSLTAEDYLVEAPYHGYWEKVWGVSEQEGRQRYRAYLDSGVQENHKPIQGAIPAIETLKERYELVIVTSRYDFLIDLTHQWLSRHFPKTFQKIEFVALWSKDEKVTKAHICGKIGAKYLIDDSVEHCNLAAGAGIKSLLFGDYGWNRGKALHPGVTRVKDWSSILRYFNAENR